MRIIWFIGLKLVEIVGAGLALAAIVFIPHYLGKWVHTWGWIWEHNAKGNCCFPYWVMGLFMCIGLPAIALIVLFFVAAMGYAWIMSNWDRAGRLHMKFKAKEADNGD